MRNSILCGGFKRTRGMGKQDKSVVPVAAVANAIESSEPHLVPGLESLYSQDFIHFKSRNLIYNQLLEALERNYMTGLHGIRGVGKTTLAKQVCLKLHESVKFDHVIFITVSKCSNIKEIQDIIADKLGLSLEGKNEWERTETIMKRFMSGKRIMLILDDVRGYINTKELGIPSRHNMKCRVLVTSRDERYCKSIGCRRSIQLEKLSKKDAWMSFKEHAGINDNSSEEVQHIRKQITEYCQGLSQIVGIATILKGRPLQVWSTILSYFTWSDFYDENWIKAYEFLNFSHNDNLNTEMAKRLSILLSLFPLNRGVPVEMLTRLGIGVGLFDELFGTYSKLRCEVLQLKDILINYHVCFKDEGGHIKMNDLIRRMIQHDYLSLCKIRIDSSHINRWVLYTMENNIHYLYYGDLQAKEMESDLIPSWYSYDGTKVKMLLINVEASNHVEISNAFFEKMTRLQVLSLSINDLHPIHALKLPISLRSLINIRSLLLSHWILYDISILGKLQSLDTLDFDDCSITEFPKEISTLKLRLLSLKRCQIEMNNPFEVIERCLSLQELYYKDNEVSNLHSVNEEAEEIYQSGTFPALNRYHLQGGEDDSISKCVCLPSIDALVSEAKFKYLIQGAEILHLKEIKGKWRNIIPEIVSGMNDLIELSLESCSKVESLVNTEQIKSHVSNVFSRLVELKLAGMDNLNQICRGTLPYDFLPSLKRLSIEHCAHLEGILFKSKVNLCNLKSVNLFDCQQLTSLFQLSTALNLVVLEELKIRECKSMTAIIEDESDCSNNVLIFPKLETLEIEGCTKLKRIFYEEEGVPPMSLQRVKLSDVSLLFNISMECDPLLASKVKRSSPRINFNAKQKDPTKDHRHKLRSDSRIKIPMEGGLTEGPISLISSCSDFPQIQSQGLNIMVVRNIKQLVLKDLHKLEYLFSLSTASLMMLEILIVDSCDVLKHIIDIGDGHDGKNFDVFLKLKELSVSSCDQLKCMFGLLDNQNYDEIHIHFSALEKLTLQKLPKFSNSPMTWTSLKEFVLVQCPDFTIHPISDMMMHFDSGKMVNKTIEVIRHITKQYLTLETLSIEAYKAESIFYRSGLDMIGNVRLGLKYLKLRNLPRMLSICVGSRSSFKFPNLKTIQIVGCAKLEVIFPASVFSYLPELEVLEIKDCYHLEQIIEEDRRLRNVDSPQPCFPKLAVLVVKSCPDLERLIPIFDVPNVKRIRIKSCDMLEVIFPNSVLRCLPELEVLEIQDCYCLEEIIEKDDKKLGNVDSPRPCFPKLRLLFVNYCMYLTRLFSASNDVPNLELLIIIDAYDLEELMGGGEQRQGDDVSIGKMKVELPKLKLLIFGELPEATFKEEKELQTVCHRFVYKCPKLLLKSTSTFKEMEEKVRELFQIDLKRLLGGFQYQRMLQGDEIVQSGVAQTVPGSELHSSEFNEKSGEEFVGEVIDSKILTTPTSLTEVQLIERPSSSRLDIPTHLHEELVDGQSIMEPCLMNQQKPLDETSEFELSKSQTYTDKEKEGHPTNIQDFKDNDRVSSSRPVEEDGQIPTPSMSVITVEHSATDGNSERKESHDLEDGRSMSESCLMSQQKPLGEAEIPQSKIGLKQILADLEESLKIPLKDIASSETNSLHLMMNLNLFLSRLPLEDVALFEGHKAIIDSLSQESPSILYSFNQAFATINKFVVLEPHINEVATMAVSKISKSKTFTGEARQKEATLKEKFFRLEKTTTDLPISLGAQTMSGNDLHSSQINEEPKKDLVGKVLDSEIPVTSTTSPLDSTLHKTHLHEMVDGQSMSESCLMNQQKPIEETESTIEIPQSIERGVEEGTRSDNANMVVASATHSESANSQSYPHREIKHSQIEISGDEDSEALPINIQDSWGKDLVKSFTVVKKDVDVQIHTPFVSDVIADNFVKVFTDLKDSLKMPLKDIACTEAYSLRLLTALNFLSNSSLEDVTLSDGLKAIIVSMHKEPESILCSFKQVFATVNKIVVLQPYLDKVAIALVSKVSMPMDEAQRKEASMKEQTSRLQNEIKDCEAKTPSLQEEKKMKFGSATTMQNSLNRLVAATDEAEKDEIEATSHVYGKYSIPECIEVLKSLKTQEYLNGQQFSYAIELLKDGSNRVILMSLKDSRDDLVNWILYKYGS